MDGNTSGKIHTKLTMIVLSGWGCGLWDTVVEGLVLYDYSVD